MNPGRGQARLELGLGQGGFKAVCIVEIGQQHGCPAQFIGSVRVGAGRAK